MKNIISIIALITAIAAIGMHFIIGTGDNKKIAFLDTQRLITSFKEAHAVNKEIEAQNKKWRADMKVMEDSLSAFMSRMSKEFDTADIKKRKALQDELSMRNQQMTNFKNHSVKKIQKLTEEKMAGVYTKVNAFMKEYGDKHGYDIIFGTVQGNIVYGTSSPADITNEIILLLNKRYE